MRLFEEVYIISEIYVVVFLTLNGTRVVLRALVSEVGTFTIRSSPNYSVQSLKRSARTSKFSVARERSFHPSFL